MGTDFTHPKTWVLVSCCASTKQSCCLAVVQPIPAACSGIQPCVRSAPAQIHSCGKTGVVHKKNGLCAESTPGCSAPSRPAQRCQYISTAPWWQHAFFFSRKACAQLQQVSVQVLEPIFPWRGREGDLLRSRRMGSSSKVQSYQQPWGDVRLGRCCSCPWLSSAAGAAL